MKFAPSATDFFRLSQLAANAIVPRRTKLPDVPVRSLAKRVIGCILLLLGLLGGPGFALAATFNVDTTGDTTDANKGDGSCNDGTGHCSLRAAIEEGNALAGDHIINIGVATINVGANGDLPTLMAKFVINGNLATVNGNHHGCFNLTDSGTANLSHSNGANGSTLTNLVINNCSGAGISANGHGFIFSNNRIGTDATGLIAVPNSGHGITISASHVYPDTSTNFLLNLYSGFPVQPVDSSQINSFSNNMVTALAALTAPITITGNVLSGNALNGLEIHSVNLAGVIVANNMIGTNITGLGAIPNGNFGVHLNASTFGNLIGPNNVISGNTSHGVVVDAGAVLLPNFVMGNRIGLGMASSAHVGNGASGVYIDTKPDSSPSNFNPSMIAAFIGPGNLISDNKGTNNNPYPDDVSAEANAGIVITGNSGGIKVVGNTIGMSEFPSGSPSSSLNFGNAGDGILITSAGSSIGSSTASDANIIAGNLRHGVVVKGSATSGTQILGNYIGVHPSFSGNLTLGNSVDGIHIDDANGTVVGGAGATDFNTIAGNGRHGIALRNGGLNDGWSNMFQRNLIYHNAGLGIDLDHARNAVDDPSSGYIPANYPNLDQKQPVICTSANGACSGFTAPSYSGGITSIDWTLVTNPSSTYRLEFSKLDNANASSATSMTFLGEQIVTTDSLNNLSGCVSGRCTFTIATNLLGSYVVVTATDITNIIIGPGNPGWLSVLKCFALSNCMINNTSEYSNAALINAGAPSATTVAPSVIAATSATVNGTVSSNGSATTVNFDYGLTAAYGSSVAASQGTLSANAVGTSVSALLTGLICNTQYHFRVRANNGSTTNGADVTFTTGACPLPTVTTNAASGMTTTTAVLNGMVSANGAATTVSFEYGSTTSYGNTIAAAQSPLASNASGIAVSAAVSGLSCNTTYHFRVDANNGLTANGNDLTFTTSACPAGAPVAVTSAASAVTATSAVLNGMVTANSSATTVSFQYGTSASYGATIAAAESPLPSGPAAAPVSVQLTGLVCNSTYHFRATALNATASANGSDMSFTTAACPVGAPICTLTATPNIVAAGSPVYLFATCSPAAASYAWTNTGFDTMSASGQVTPAATTSYSVIGSNGVGSGNSAAATVTVSSSASSATVYNIPSPTNTDQPFIRVYNPSNAAGTLTATLFNQDGSLLGNANSVLSASIPANSVQVFAASDIAAAMGVGNWVGRAWMIVTANFAGLRTANLVRSSLLVNMSCMESTYVYVIPSPSNPVQPFIRLYNTSGTAGPITGTLYDQSGNVLGTPNSVLVANLAAHAVQVMSAADVANAFGVATWSGRAWMQLSSGFTGLKIMGLLRDPASNTLSNVSCDTGSTGASANVYNLPPPGSSSSGFIRIYNTSAATMSLNGTLYNESGTVLGAAGTSLGTLAPHAVAVFAQSDIATKFGVAGWTGRAWMTIASSGSGLKVTNFNSLSLLMDTGCTESTYGFNLPDAFNATDQLNLRLYNTSSTSGNVYATLYDPNGNVLGTANSTLVSGMKGKSVALFSASALAAAMHVPSWSGRAWIKLSSDFTGLKVLDILQDIASGNWSNLSCTTN